MIHPNHLISVVIPCYNAASFLAEALDSVLSQSYSHLDIILVDDGSTDETSAICQKYQSADSRIRYFKQINQGPSSARNHGIREAKGEFICLLDADDKMDFRRIALQLDVFKKNPEIDIVYTSLKILDAKGTEIGLLRSHDYDPRNFLAHMFFRNLIPGPSTIMVKAFCLKNHPYDEKFKHAEDYELMIRLAHLYRFNYLDSPLTSYRRHANNLSNDLASHRQTELKVLNKYGPRYIEDVVEKSNMSEKEKLLLKGKIFFNIERWNEALKVLELSTEPISYFYKGNVLIKLGRTDEAKECYEKALKLDSSNAAAYNNLGVIYSNKYLIKEAQIAFETALQLKPGYIDARENLKDIKKSISPQKFTFRELRSDLIPYQQDTAE